MSNSFASVSDSRLRADMESPLQASRGQRGRRECLNISKAVANGNTSHLELGNANTDAKLQ